ncbi:MAG: AAA family ATPase, partial [Chloroflexota bacterium]
LLSDPACRLLTLVGPGGIGKTRLALEAARQLPLPENTHFVALQPLASAEFIVSAIADSVGFQFYSGSDPKQQLLDYLREKSRLLLLDNFEHLLDGATLLSEILTNAPGIRILVTSRERLNLVEEWVLEVGGLAYPISANDSQAGRYSAVELFALRAQRVNVGFVLNEAQRPAVVRICRLVGGMPLGIELAASWTRALSCEAIADEIERSLDILETPARNVEPRHRTMRAAFAPTWNRLSDEERAVFMKLSVFRGGCTREAAEQVAGASLRILSTLVDQSLLRVDANGRYDLHELLRQYAAEKLLDSGELETTMQAHLDYFLKFAEQVEAHNFGREQIFWYDRVEVELDNLRVALSWSLETETGLRLATALGWFWNRRDHWTEGREWLEKFLAEGADVSLPMRAKAVHHILELNFELSDYPSVAAWYDEGLRLAHEVDDPRLAAWLLTTLGFVTSSPGEQHQAYLEEAATQFRQLRDRWGLCETLVRLRRLYTMLRDYRRAEALEEEVTSLVRESGDKLVLSWCLFGSASNRFLQGQIDARTESLYQESLALFEELGVKNGSAAALYNIGVFAHLRGEDEQARTLFRRSLKLSQPVGRKEYVLGCLIQLAEIICVQGEAERGAKILGASSDLILAFYTDSNSSDEYYRMQYGRALATLRASLDERALTQAWGDGRAMT